MTLRDLLKKCRYKDVFNILHQEYYKKKQKEEIYQADCGYRAVFNNLLMLPHLPWTDKGHEYQIYIRKNIDEINEDNDEFIDVSLYCEEDEQIYAMDFTPWEDLIDAEIRKGVFLDDCTILAHILWEITFYGYTREAVKEAEDNLKELSDKIESGEEKLIPWEDIKQELDLDEED